MYIYFSKNRQYKIAHWFNSKLFNEVEYILRLTKTFIF